jgi:hypothetical protein
MSDDNVISINSDIDPAQIALVDALHKTIQDMALGELTPIEIIGALEIVKMDIYSAAQGAVEG